MDKSDDLKLIREIMERSSRFISLSGLSGVGAGIIAIAGTALGWLLLTGRIVVPTGLATGPFTSIAVALAIAAIIILVAAVAVALFFSMKKARKLATPFWTPVSRRLVAHILIPLAAGGLFSMLLLYYNVSHLIPSAMLIFYGVALVSAGKFTFGEISALGITEIITGVIAGFFPGLGLWFWAFGFGVLHIVYGIIMHLRYK